MMTKRLFSLVISASVVAFLAASCQAPALEEIQEPGGQETEVVPERTTIPYSLKVGTEGTRVSFVENQDGTSQYVYKDGDYLHIVGLGDRADIVGDLTEHSGDNWSGTLSYSTDKGQPVSGTNLEVTLIHADNLNWEEYGTALVGGVPAEDERTLLQYAVENYSLFTAQYAFGAEGTIKLEQQAAFLDVTVEFDFDGSHIIDAGKALVDLSVNQKDIQMETDFYEKSGTNGEDFYVHFIAVVPGEKPVSNFTLTVGDRPITFSDTSLYLYRNRKYTVNRTIEFHPQVGDPFWSDGTYGRLRHPSSQEKIVGIVVFVHDFKENMTDGDIKIADAITEKREDENGKQLFGHGLVMALKNVTETNGNQVQKGFKWCSSSATSQQCTAGYITNPNQTMDSPYFSGLENTNNIISKAGYENDSAAARAKNYTYDGIAVSTSSTTGWFLPSIGQWMYTISEDGFGGADPASEWTNGKGTLWLKDGYQPDSGGNLGDLVFVKRSEDSRPEVNVLVKSLNDRLAQFHNEFGVSYDTFGDPSTEANISDNYWTSTEYASDKAIRMNLGTVEQRAGVYYSTIKAKGESKTISYYTYNSNSYQMKVRPFLAF